MVDVQTAALAGSFAGVFFRTLVDYIQARNQQEESDPTKPLEFDRKFLITAIIAAGTAGTFALVSFPTTVSQIPADATLLQAFIFAASAGLGIATNHYINKIAVGSTNTIRASKEKIRVLKDLAKAPLSELKELSKGINQE